MDGGALWAAVHGVARSQTQLSDFTFTFRFHALEKAMATHSSVLAWRIPGDRGAWWAAVYGVAQSWTWQKWLSSSSSRQWRTEEVEVMQSMGLQRVGHNLRTEQQQWIALSLQWILFCFFTRKKITKLRSIDRAEESNYITKDSNLLCLCCGDKSGVISLKSLRQFYSLLSF